MSARNWLENHRWMVAIGLVLALTAAAVSLFLGRGRYTPPPAKRSYYFDLDSGKLLVASPGPAAPAVHAAVFACGECLTDGRFIVYLSKADQELAASASQAMKQSQTPERDDRQAVRHTGAAAGRQLIAAYQPPPMALDWQLLTPQSQATLVSEAQQKCSGGQPLLPCLPKDNE